MALPEPLRIQEHPAQRVRRRASVDTQPVMLHPSKEEREKAMLSAMEQDMRTHLSGEGVPFIRQAEHVIDESLWTHAWNLMHTVGEEKGNAIDEVPYESRRGVEYLVVTSTSTESGETPAIVGKVVAPKHKPSLGIGSLEYRTIQEE